MAVYQLPSNLLISNVSLEQEIPTFTNESINLKVSSKDRGLHRLNGSLDITIGDMDAQRAYIGFIARMRGRSNQFVLDLPHQFKNTDVTNPSVVTAVSAGATQFQLSAFTGTILAGTMFNMPNDTKTYIVLNDCNSGDVLTFFPAMRQDHIINSIVNVRTPVITAHFTEDNQTIEMAEAGQIIQASISWSEIQ